MTKYNVLLITIIYNDAKEMLMTRRWRDPEKGKWSLPGGVGALDVDADPNIAAAIEVRGEFAADYVDYNIFEIIFAELPEPTLRLYFFGKIKGQPKTTGIYKSEFKWFSIDEAIKTEIAFEEKDKEVIKHFKHKILNAKRDDSFDKRYS